jgi:hypothetical protein
MANINRAIRLYQPNDPYYWQVDNLPLTDLLGNDIVLEERIGLLEDTVKGLADNNKGSFGLGALADLKAWAEPTSGTSQDFGKVFVRPGKFTARMQLPASRESGWRMMRDDDNNFNNTSFAGDQGLNSTTVTDDFVRYTKGMGRTSVVEVYPNSDGSDKSVVIESFDATEFNSNSAPVERLDLVYIKATGALDTDHTNLGIPLASIGIIKGAYFRTDSGAGLQSNGSRFETETGRLAGRMTGMASSEITTGTNFGSVPSPDDLTNFAWHRRESSPTPGSTVGWNGILQENVETQAAFTLPVAYVRVPQGYTAGQPIPVENVIDIRPFFRSTELSYSERAAIVASYAPNGSNPFVTDSRLMFEIGKVGDLVQDLATQVQETVSLVNILQDRVNTVQVDVNQLKLDVSGTNSSPTPGSLNHEGRIAALEVALGGGINVPVERHAWLQNEFSVFNNLKVNALGGSEANAVSFDITDAIPANNRASVKAVQFRVYSYAENDNDTDSPNFLYMRGGGMNYRMVSMWAFRPPGGEHRFGRGNVNTFYAPVNKSASGNQLSIEVYATGSSDVFHSVKIDGYIYTSYIS